MSLDLAKNFAYMTVLTAPSPATSGTSLVVSSGGGALLPAAPFNCTVWPTGVGPVSTNAEIVRVTNISGDTLTIVRAQEGSTARAIIVGDQFAQTITAKLVSDLISMLVVFSAGNAGLVPNPGTPSGLFLKDDGTFASPTGTGDVVGPGSATDGRPALFDGVTGKLIKEAAAALGSAAFAATTAFDAAGAAAAAQAASQPLDADLTAIAALSTTSFGRAFLTLADAAAARTATGTVIGTDVQAWRSILDKVYVHGADVASAGTINLDTATGDLIDVTGTTTITAITLAEGVGRVVRFTGALTLTNGASLVLPGAANITTAAGDFAIFRGYAAGVVRCVVYSFATTSAARSRLGLGTGDSPTFTAVNTTSAGTVSVPAVSISDPDTGFYNGGLNGRIAVTQNGAVTCVFSHDSNVLCLNNDYKFGWSPSNRTSAGEDTALERISAGLVGINNGSAGTFRDLKLRNLTPTGGNGLAVFTVATLPASAATGLFAGSRVYVTDSNAVSYTAGIGSIVAAGGSTVVPVFYDGSQWRIG